MRKIADMTPEERIRYSGNINQLYGVRSVTLDEGTAHGASIWEVETGGGLTLEVLPDNGMDLGMARYRGHNVNYLCKNGYTSPYSFSAHEDDFTNYFSGGLMYTCGLMNAGGGCRDGEKWHPSHGRIHFIPSDRRAAQVDEAAGVIRLSGRVREAQLFGHNLQIERTVTLPIGGSEITVEDTLSNLSPNPIEYMILYHCNFGFPFLSENLTLELPEGTKTTPRTARAAEGMDCFRQFTGPVDSFEEQVYFHDVPAQDGMATVRAINNELKMGMAISQSKETLPVLTQWKSMQSTDYVLGLEPGNTFIMGRAKERENGTLPVLAPFEKRRFKVSIRFFDI